ncbi:MAG: hypothetical protein JSS61_06255 [Verrucomicrobia bacterium]|nr:hypothetical protein [Verrucomicrobiota bacterium]
MRAFLLILPLLLCCCDKPKVAPRAIYDQTAFQELFVAASQEEGVFSQYKRNPYFNLLWENCSEEEGRLALVALKAEYPHLLPFLERLKRWDAIGSPRLATYEGVGDFSPATLQVAAWVGAIEKQVGPLKGLHVVLIGSEEGALAYLLHEMGCELTIVDLPEPLLLAKKVWESLEADRAEFTSLTRLPKDGSYDLILSHHNFSEFGRKEQDLLIERALLRADRGYLIGRLFPKHFGVEAYPVDELMTKLHARDVEIASRDRADYSIFW